MNKSRVAGFSFAALMKWVGIAAVLISFGTTLYELAHAEGELRERKRVVSEQVAAGRRQQAAGDYTSAWESFASASTTAEADGLFAKLLGGLSSERQQIRAAQEDLAMQWVRAAHAPEGHSFAEIVDKLVGVLSTGASIAGGARKADLLAHLGWGYFLKVRDGNTDLRPDTPYRDAIEADANNPYAHVFWGHWILWNRGSLGDASTHFATALASNRVKAEVRRFQLAALGNVHGDDADAAWWQAVNEMRLAGEGIEDSVRNDMQSRYYFALNDDSQMRKLAAAVPAADHVQLQRMLLQSTTLDQSRRSVLIAVMASMLEAAGRPDEALATWQKLQSQTRSEPNSTLAPRAEAAIKRLRKVQTRHS